MSRHRLLERNMTESARLNQKLWHAIDQLAANRGLSTSGLARKAGLDPTAFNKSKRQSRDGRLRWPSTESISRVMTATGVSFSQFAALVDKAPPSP